MKYSFILPYYRRLDHLWNTLLSYRNHYAGQNNDWEVVVVVDQASDDEEKLLEVLDSFQDLPICRMNSPVGNGINPVIARNAAAVSARGQYLVQTNPECMHKENVLTYFDQVLQADPETYIVCACEDVRLDGRAKAFRDLLEAKHLAWYDHPKHNARMLHWCSCLSRTQYMAVGGFDEYYHQLIGYDDNDFLQKIRHSGMRITYQEAPAVSHIHHEKMHENADFRPAFDYYNSKWGW